MEKQSVCAKNAHTKTAVEWLIEQIELYEIKTDIFNSMYFNVPKRMIEQAKEMEKEQIEQAFSIGEMNNDSHHYTGRKIHKDQADYYNKTYAK
jgi:uncharacterized protein YcaQ